MIKIHLFQAGYGDSFLVQLSPDTESEINIMIDCGFGYKENILPKLKAVLGKDKKIDRFIITHYDADHINGAILFFKDNGKSEDAKIVKVDQVWLNTYRHLQFHKREDGLVNYADGKKIEAYIASCKSKERVNIEGEIGALQATTLGAELLKNGYNWNSDSQENAISIDYVSIINLGNNASIQLLNPNNQNLKLLETDFLVDLARAGLKPKDDELFDDAFEFYSLSEEKAERILEEGTISSSDVVISKEFIQNCSENVEYIPDNSSANGSSIAFILNQGEKRLLFLGDANSEDIINAVVSIRKREENYPLFFDAIKVSHHGSFRSSGSELFKYIDSGKFIFSTNGKHPKHTHPDIETIACIINRQLSEGIERRELIFNYELDHLRGLYDESLQNDFKYDIKVEEHISL